MWLDDRNWIVEPRSDLEQLARDLLTKRFPLHQAFISARGTILANISASAEETCLKEYAILRPASEGAYNHVRSFVVSWSNVYWLTRYFDRADRREFDTLFDDHRIDAVRFNFEPPASSLE